MHCLTLSGVLETFYKGLNFSTRIISEHIVYLLELWVLIMGSPKIAAYHYIMIISYYGLIKLKKDTLSLINNFFFTIN